MTHNNAHALRRVVRTPYYVRHVKRSLKHVRRPWRDTFLVLCAREGAAGSSPPGANFPRRFSTRAKCLQVPSEESAIWSGAKLRYKNESSCKFFFEINFFHETSVYSSRIIRDIWQVRRSPNLDR